MKPVVEYLILHGHLSTIYLDDILLMGSSYYECIENVNITKKLLYNLGFITNDKKSNLEPKTCCKFLGLILDIKHFVLNFHRKNDLK